MNSLYLVIHRQSYLIGKIKKISNILREHGHDVGEPLIENKPPELGEQIELL